MRHHWNAVVTELIELIEANSWTGAFNTAIEQARAHNIPELDDIKTVDDYLEWINAMLRWVPSENSSGRQVYDELGKFTFILDQPPLLALQNRVAPRDRMPALTPLSAWMVRYANAMGAFLDTPESLTAESLKTFYDSPKYNMDDYLVPHGGWKTFNQFFARNTKPGRRPVADIANPNVIVSPADSTFAGHWSIDSESSVTVKSLRWSVGELLEGSPYKDRFADGHFMHAFLSPTDYHRQHTPVAGTVLEARVIPGQVSIEIVAEPVPGSANGRNGLTPRRRFKAPDNVGYQFAQARGLIVIESVIGLVAVLPIGMSQVSSVILTAEKGAALRKGEELSYFQFGGSDVVALFESKSSIKFSAETGVHYDMGTKIAEAQLAR